MKTDGTDKNLRNLVSAQIYVPLFTLRGPRERVENRLGK